jgi:hypothetical protein
MCQRLLRFLLLLVLLLEILPLLCRMRSLSCVLPQKKNRTLKRALWQPPRRML